MEPLLPFLPPQASTFAGEVDLLTIVLILLGALFAGGIAIAITFFAIHYRRGNDVDRSNPPHTGLTVEIAWSIIPLIIALGVYGWSTNLYFRMMRAPETALDVYAVGKMWMWKFQHTSGAREINQLHVPVGQPVRLTMTSQDVIHDFFVPAFRIKYDVIPGRYTTAWFEATEPGTYHLFCAEYCGLEHSHMIGSVVVMTPADYEEWLAQNNDPNLAARAVEEFGGDASQVELGPMAEAGQTLFVERGCTSCHAMEGEGIGPSLVGVFGSEVQLEDGGSIVADEEYLRRSILEPNAHVVAGYPAGVMPTYEGQLNDEQLMQMIEYIKSLGADGSTTGGAMDAAQDDNGEGE